MNMKMLWVTEPERQSEIPLEISWMTSRQNLNELKHICICGASSGWVIALVHFYSWLVLKPVRSKSCQSLPKVLDRVLFRYMFKEALLSSFDWFALFNFIISFVLNKQTNAHEHEQIKPISANWLLEKKLQQMGQKKPLLSSTYAFMWTVS